MKKAFSISLLIVFVVAGLSFAAFRMKSAPGAVEPDEAREEGRRFREVLRERGIEHPTEEVVAGLCKEGFTAACAEEGRLLLVKCQQSEGSDSASCDQARTSLDTTCGLGSIHSCDVIFQADELVSVRPHATVHLEKFCDARKPQACKTFEVALRNWIDLDRKNGTPEAAARNVYRAKYVKVSNINCDRGFYFSCLALIDEDRSTAVPQALASAEDRLRGICKKASDRFEREDCLSFAEYLALSDRRSEAEKYVAEVCAEGSEAGCLSALRIQLDGLRKSNQVPQQFDVVKATCAEPKKGALLVDYCKAFKHAVDVGANDWDHLKSEPALLESAHKATFEEILTIQPRERY